MRRLFIILVAILVTLGLVSISGFGYSYYKEQKKLANSIRKQEYTIEDKTEYVIDSSDANEDIIDTTHDNEYKDKTVDQTYNYLSNLQLLQSYFIKESAYLKLGNQFDKYVKGKYKSSGEEYVIQDAMKGDGSVIFYAKSSSDNEVFVTYKSTANKFFFTTDMPKEMTTR